MCFMWSKIGRLSSEFVRTVIFAQLLSVESGVDDLIDLDVVVFGGEAGNDLLAETNAN
jgi:hypothetical protein